MAPLVLTDGDTLRRPPEQVRGLVDARRILDPATGEAKPPGSQLADTQRHFREEAARTARLQSARGGGPPQPTGSFDPLGPFE